MPTDLQPGILYISEEFEVAGHLCACGCNNKVITPLGPTEWSFSEAGGKPTLRPSIGNWELPCRSHYIITKGRIEWADQWTQEEVQVGRMAEEKEKRLYYKSLRQIHKRPSKLLRFFSWLFGK
ncbi:MAG: DUF6527 family protein [Ferruginibacter sp.]